MQKQFAREYWSARCPFSYSQDVVDTLIIPGLKSNFGPGFAAYDLSTPKIEDLGGHVMLTYQTTRPPSSSPDVPGPRLRIDIDRCGPRFEKAWQYWP